MSDRDPQYNLPEDTQNPPSPASADEMDPLAADAGVREFVESAGGRGYLVFTEDRRHPIRWTNRLPARWLEDQEGHLENFSGAARPGEFYVFQLAVCAIDEAVGPLEVRFADLRGASGESIPATACRCFNLGGVGPDGRTIRKEVTVPAGQVQPLWVGVDLPAEAQGSYSGILTVAPAGREITTIDLALDVSGEPLLDHGEADAWRLARLRWLDSAVGHGDTVVAPFTPVRRAGRTLSILGRELTLDHSGLPRQIAGFFSGSNTHLRTRARHLLAEPVVFEVETGTGAQTFGFAELGFEARTDAVCGWHASGQNRDFGLEVSGALEFDGFVQYRLRLRATRAASVRDIRLRFPCRRQAVPYLMGLDRQGGRRPESLSWKWNVRRHQDAVWLGDVNLGLQLRLKDADFARPLINIYYDFKPLRLPVSWGNGGRGGIAVEEVDADTVTLTAYSSPRELRAGEVLCFDFDLYLTPFKLLDQQGQWRYRYLHPTQGIDDPHFDDFSLVADKGATVVNMHHCTRYNPFINYPYNDLSFPGLIDCVRRAHAAGLLLKLYYTTREITTHRPELHAFRSLGDEVIFPTDQENVQTVINREGPHPWLVEHLGPSGYIPAWRETLTGPYDGILDLAVITAPDTRWNNFYLEGLRYLVERAGIDGLYIDDTALDRRSLQRARRILDRRNPESQIDFHSWNHFNDLARRASCAVIYAELFPYINRIWFGEGFDYDRPPEYWLVEICGIPFGLMGEMLQDGGNPWRGMVYGMTPRLGWAGDPRPLWKFFDVFGMGDAEMVGYWDSECPVRTGDEDIPATAYRRRDALLISLASWAAEPRTVRLRMDVDRLGFSPGGELSAPAIENFQPERIFPIGAEIPVDPGRGWLLILRASTSG